MRAYLLTFFSAATLFSAYGAPNFSTSMKMNDGPFSQGDTGDIYEIDVINSGTATNGVGTVTITDTLPTGLSHLVIKDIPSGYACNILATTLTCTTTNVILGGHVDKLYFEVDVSKTAPASLTNTAYITYPNTMATPVPVSDVNQTITQEPYLTITKTQTNPAYNGNPLPVGYGQSLTNKIDVDNIGGAPTTGTVTVVDTVASDMIVTGATGGSAWNCTHTATVATCTANAAILMATVGGPGEPTHDILVTAVLLGSTASDVASVTFFSTVNMVAGPTTNTTSASSTVGPTLTNVTFVSISMFTDFVNVDGTSYPSGTTLPEDLTLNHRISAPSNCFISAPSNFTIVETRPNTPPPGPWMEVTGEITGTTVAINCN